MLVPRQSPDFPHRADVSSLRVTPAYSLNTLLNAEIPGLRRRSNIHSVIATAKVSSRLVLPIAGSGGEYYTDTASDRGSARGDPPSTSNPRSSQVSAPRRIHRWASHQIIALPQKTLSVDSGAVKMKTASLVGACRDSVGFDPALAGRPRFRLYPDT